MTLITSRDTGRPSDDFAKVTPSDSVTINLTAYIYIGVAGDLAVENNEGDKVVFPLLQGYHPIRTTKIYATGTSIASDKIFCFWG